MICKNCNTTLNESLHYCYHCGAKVIRNRLTFRNLFEHLSETFFNYDNKLLRTFIALFRVPEDVIGGYINGVRKKYVNPISLFGLALTLVGLEWFFLKKFFPEQLNLSAMAVNGTEDNLNKVFGFMQNYSSIMMMLFVPIYALVSRTVFFDNKTFNYVEHIIAFTYMMAFISIFGAIVNIILIACGISLGVIGYINMPIQIIYISYCFKRLYKTSLTEIIGRMLLSFVVFFIVYIIIIILVIVLFFLIEGKDGFLEFFKPK